MKVIPSRGPNITMMTPFEQAVDKLEIAATVPAVVQRLLGLLADPDARKCAAVGVRQTAELVRSINA